MKQNAATSAGTISIENGGPIGESQVTAPRDTSAEILQVLVLVSPATFMSQE